MNAKSVIDYVKRVPTFVLSSTCGIGLLAGSLIIVSFAASNVVAPQGFETVAMAKPAAVIRTIRQHDVAQFGSKVSNAFGIKNQVAHEFADWILEASERQELTPELLASLVVTESSFRKHARSNVGAVGPTQVRPDYWGSFCGAKDLTDPEQNVYCGAQVLSHLFERCDGDRSCALAAYNVGPYAKREAAAKRYVAKIDRYLLSLANASSDTSL